MSHLLRAAVLVCLLLLGGCTTADHLPDWVVSVDSDFVTSGLLDTCVEGRPDPAQVLPAASPEAAVAVFTGTSVLDGDGLPVLRAEGVEVSPTTITFDGVEVGTVEVRELVGGGYGVVEYAYCHPRRQG